MLKKLIAAAATATAIVGFAPGSAGPPFTAPSSAARADGYAAAAPPRFPAAVGSNIHIDAAGVRLVAEFENVLKSRYCPEPDPVLGWSVPTRGFGETEGIGPGSGCISQARAFANLQRLIEARYQWAVRGLGVDLNHHQVDALDSFVWNLGAGIFTGQLRWDLQHREFFAASQIMLQYDHAGGRVISGLSTRRHREAQLFLTPERAPLTPAEIRAARVKRLHADFRERGALDSVLARHRCLHGYRGFSKQHRHDCNVWRARHAAVSRDIKRLHKLGAR